MSPNEKLTPEEQELEALMDAIIEENLEAFLELAK